MPVDLSDVLDRADPRVRIRTNLAIYWDRIVYTVDEAPAPLRRTALPLVSAELSFRGFSRMTRETPDGPQVFVHDDVSTAAALGRHGRALHALRRRARARSTAADDRYVVMKGGDAVRLRVRRRARCRRCPRAGSATTLLVLDGWDKDADKNTVAGQTVEPLPFHGMDDARYGELAFPRTPMAHRGVRPRVPDAARAGRRSSVDAVRGTAGRSRTR